MDIYKTCVIEVILISLTSALYCEHEIYCKGKLLHEVQMSKIFADSKTFVDLKLKFPTTAIIKSFEKYVNSTDSTEYSHGLGKWVKANFDPIASEFEKWTPPDWKKSPLILKRIKDKKLHEFARKLNGIWKFLGRRVTDLVREHQELYSIIYIPYGVIIPGGRFREIYYWDSYWIIKGLIQSEMLYTARGILANFSYIIQRYGLIPNGGRIYYCARSQPPMLVPSMKIYMDATNDMDFLREHLDIVEKEFEFWIHNRTMDLNIGGKTYKVARYYDDSYGPRPESYREDIYTAKVFNTDEEKLEFYREMRTAAEAGLDFTSRWFMVSDGSTKGQLHNTKVRSIVPVELNALIYLNAKILSRFAKMMGLKTKATKYSNIAQTWKETVDKVFWHKDIGCWLDYDLINRKRRNHFYPSNISPLWTGCFFKDRAEDYAEKVMSYLDRNQAKAYPGGIPASLEKSGQQWDFPNAWPPHQDMIITGLENTDDPRAQQMAREFARKWVLSNYQGWVQSTVMHEKYDSTIFGGAGFGGEYESQMGFGWTNGLVLDLLNRYTEQIDVEEDSEDTPVTRTSVSSLMQIIMVLNVYNAFALALKWEEKL